MKVKDIMTRDVVSVDKDEGLDVVLDLMEKHKISKLPVTEKGKLVGLISDGEIADELGAIKNKGVSPTQLHASSAMRRDYPSIHADADVEDAIELAKREDVGLIPVVHDDVCIGLVTKADFLDLVKADKPVESFMITELESVQPTDRVIHARRIMIDTGVERVPVLDGGKLVGIVGESDVAFGLFKFKKTFADNHQAERLRHFLVEDIMVRNVVTAAPDTKASEAAHVMRERDVGSLPILNSGDKIAGMITRTDLIRLLET